MFHTYIQIFDITEKFEVFEKKKSWNLNCSNCSCGLGWWAAWVRRWNFGTHRGRKSPEASRGGKHVEPGVAAALSARNPSIRPSIRQSATLGCGAVHRATGGQSPGGPELHGFRIWFVIVSYRIIITNVASTLLSFPSSSSISFPNLFIMAYVVHYFILLGPG